MKISHNNSRPRAMKSDTSRAESIEIEMPEGTDESHADKPLETAVPVTLHWSLKMSVSDEHAYSAMQTRRRGNGTIIVAASAAGYSLRRIYLIATGGSLAWSGTAMHVVFFSSNALLVIAGVAVSYWRWSSEQRYSIEIKHASLVVFVALYLLFGFVLLDPSIKGTKDYDCEERLVWVTVGGVFRAVPLYCMLCSMPLLWNTLGLLFLTACYNSAPPVYHSIATITNEVLQTFVILLVLYQTEYLLRTAFLLAQTRLKEAANAQTLASSFSGLVSTISHDLKTPTSAIQVGLRLLVRLCDRKEFDKMELVLVEMNNAMKMSVSFLDSLTSSAALLDKGDTELEANFYAMSVPDVIDSALGTCRLYSTNQFEFTSAVQEGLEFCVSSETMLVRNLLNLVTNAVKHAGGGTIHTTARFKCFPDLPGEMFIEFTVSDSGSGIGKAYRGVNQERIWMPFESGAGSTGLGLFVVKRQCDVLNGRCGWYDNEPHGTVFWFAVPYIAETTGNCTCTTGNVQPAACMLLGNPQIPPTAGERLSAQNWPSSQLVEVPPNISYATCTILLIDDDVIQSNILTMEFKSLGIHKVETAAGPAAGLRMLQQDRYAIVFCDYSMPIQNGADLVSVFREWEHKNRQGEPMQPIWALTAEQSDKAVSACRGAGMNGIFTKPLDSTLALQLIESLSNQTEYVQLCGKYGPNIEPVCQM